jgi:hypothetical protein
MAKAQMVSAKVVIAVQATVVVVAVMEVMLTAAPLTVVVVATLAAALEWAGVPLAKADYMVVKVAAAQ